MGFWRKLLESIASSGTTWIVTFAIGILTIFSSQITESVKFAINRADMRTKQYEELATEVSNYIFSAELNVEFIEHGWTTKKSMTALVDDYNKSIEQLRKKEFVYHSWIQKFWGKNEADEFESFMKSVRESDSAMHLLNDQYEAVNIAESQKKIDENSAKEALKIMKPAVEHMRRQGIEFLKTLEGRFGGRWWPFGQP